MKTIRNEIRVSFAITIASLFICSSILAQSIEKNSYTTSKSDSVQAKTLESLKLTETESVLTLSDKFGEDFNNKDSLLFPQISFIPDTLHIKKRSIWSNDAIFSVSDEKKQEWKIVAPPQTGLYGVQIQTTAMKDISVDSNFGDAIAGLQLEPSGFLFSDPIKINISIDSNKNEKPIIFFMTDQFGNITGIPNQCHDKNNYTIEVTHFSGLIGFGLNNIENICMISKIATSSCISKARSLITTNPQITTPPMSYERKCDEEYSRLLHVNVAKMMEPERSAIADILTYHRGVSLSCGSSDIMGSVLPNEIVILSDQLVKKALNAIKEYQDQPDKFSALAIFVINAGRDNSLFSSPNADENNKKIWAALIEWQKNNVNYYKKKIAEEHDYFYFRTLTDCYADLALLSDDISLFPQMIKQLEDLLRFDLEIEVHVYRDCQGSDWSTSEHTITKGTVELVFDFEYYEENKIFPSPNFTHKLVGTGNFTTEGKAERKGQGETDVSTVIPDVFEKKYTVQLNFCEMKGDIKCMSPGNSKEEWEGDEFINSSLKMIRFTNTFFNELNQYYDNKGLFEFRISNGQEVLVDDMSSVVREFDDGEQKVRTVFYYKLIHKPKY